MKIHGFDVALSFEDVERFCRKHDCDVPWTCQEEIKYPCILSTRFNAIEEEVVEITLEDYLVCQLFALHKAKRRIEEVPSHD